MSGQRACLACRTAKAKCNLARPTCTRCAERGLVCSGLPLESVFTFRDENEVAKRNSQRARRQRPQQGGWPGPASSVSGVLVQSQDEPSDAAADGGSESLQEEYWWLNELAIAQVPGPLKRDVETRAVERFFVNWILHPNNRGTTPGYMHELPLLFHDAEHNSVLWLAVRAMAFADMRNQRAGNVPFQVKARQHYGAALNGMRAVIADQQDLGDDRVLLAMLLIDNFELMYLARKDPFSAHGEAIRHILHTRGEMQLYAPTRFSLWRLSHYRLQAWQTLAREQPDAQQIDWLHKLDMERPGLRICSHVLHMNILSALSKTLTQSTGDDASLRAEKLNRAEELALEMQDLAVSVENWALEMTRVWNVEEDDSRNIAAPQDVGESSRYPIPHFPYPRLITYDDIWLAYIWNFYAASQIVLRESLVDVIEYAALLRGEEEPDNDGAAVIQKQREWVDVLSAAILKSFPQLLGFAYRHEGAGRPPLAQQGRMAGRLFALFSMWVVQRGRLTSPQHKHTASEVIRWINSRHELG